MGYYANVGKRLPSLSVTLSVCKSEMSTFINITLTILYNHLVNAFNDNE